MRAIRLTSAAALGLVALSFTAPASAAAPAVDRKASTVVGTATPSTIAPGGQVTLLVSGCAGDATASSAVFPDTVIPKGRTATAVVDWDARRGATYLITYSCPGRPDATSQLTITGGKPTATSTTRPTATPTPTVTTTATATRSPAGPARGGVGGSIGGMDTGEIAAGAALVVAATGGLIFVLRRRRSSRQH